MIYKSFASVYDDLMTDTPYEKWLENIIDVFCKYNITGNNILDLACGTGELTNMLAKKGYNILGVDLSPEMLEIAQNKAYNSNIKVNYIKQDMRELDLFTTYDGIISFCDGFNYILDIEDLKKVFLKVNESLNSDGLFVFDISSEYKLREILGNNVFSDTDEELTYVWENYYDEDTNIVEFDLSIFIKDGNNYIRENENHKQRGYKIEEIKALMKDCGFSLLEILDTNTYSEVEYDSERVMFVGRKNE